MNYEYFVTIEFREATAGKPELDSYYKFISKHKARRLKGGREEGTSKLIMNSRIPLVLDGLAAELGDIPIVFFEEVK